MLLLLGALPGLASLAVELATLFGVPAVITSGRLAVTVVDLQN
jgi:hypothetical protein